MNISHVLVATAIAAPGVFVVLIASTLIVRRRRRWRRRTQHASVSRQPWGPPNAGRRQLATVTMFGGPKQ